MEAVVQLERDWLAEFCRRYHVRRMALFGSALRVALTPRSDVDFLVEFERGCTPGFFTIGQMMEELTAQLGRQADVRTPEDLGRGIREQVLATAEPLYVAD